MGSGDDEKQVKCIREGEYTFKGEKWKTVSPDAFDFVQKLMVVDPLKRMNAEKALKHKWFEILHLEMEHKLSDHNVVSSMYEFAQASKFRRTCMLAMAWSLSNEERSKVRQAFMQMDQEKHGTITIKDFKKSYRG